MWIGPGALDLESMVAHGFVKHGSKVLLHRVVDGPLQAAWFNEPHAFIPTILVYIGPKTQPGNTPTGKAGVEPRSAIL